jgi:hypothetical protein
LENSLRGVCAAACFLVCSIDASFAFSSPPSCDLVALRSTGAGARLGDDAWTAYRKNLLQVLRTAPQQKTSERDLADDAIGLQETALERLPAGALAAYRKSPECKVLAKLEPHALAAFGDASALDPVFAPAAAQLQRLTEAALRDLADALSRARFRTREHRKLFEAGYHCFIASLVHSASPPAKQPALTLQSFGQTVACADLKRTE